MRILCLLATLLLFSCANEKAASVLNPDALPTQLFTINPDQDTILTTANGALIRVAAGSFTGADSTVSLQVKEAYSIEDILKAGLTTQSGNELLRSDGMIFLDAREKEVKIIKPLAVSLPTDNYQPGMLLFTGEEKEGTINWTDPKPIGDTLPEEIAVGKAVFDANCATCHALDKNLTAPALSGVEDRGPWNDRKSLLMFVRNPGAFIPMTEYTMCLLYSYHGQVMPAFPQLDDQVLNAVFDYIKFNEKGSSADSPVDLCLDSCRRYDSAMLAVNMKRLNRIALVADNGPMTEVHYSERGDSTTPRGRNIFPPDDRDENLVSMEDNNAEYYKFSIDAFGWYNIDAFLKKENGAEETTLTVQLDGEVKKHVDIYLVIPSIKLFTKAGRTGRENEFAFYTKDGKVLLPHGVQAYLVAMSENEEGVLFSQQAFITKPSQHLAIAVKPSSKEEVYAAFKKMDTNDLAVKVEETKNASAIRQADKEIKTQQQAADIFRPKNCNCSCTADTLRSESVVRK